MAGVADAASYTVTGGAFVGTANYKGVVGASLTYTWAAATDASGSAGHTRLDSKLDIA